MKFAFQQSHLLKTILGGSVLFSLIVGFLCISFVHAMPAHASMDMGSMHSHTEHTASLNNCCDTGANDHMELWKSTFVGIPQSLQQLMALVAVALLVTLTLADFFPLPRLSENLLSIRFRQYAREHPNVFTYNSLRLAFARGILHPKTY
jgi:hypothetical protein